jgi:hypothetical protein
VEKLGLDIPPPPEVTLEEITAREIRVAWKQPDFHNSIHKHIIQVNNVKGTFYLRRGQNLRRKKIKRMPNKDLQLASRSGRKPRSKF